MKYNIPPEATCGVYIIRSSKTNDFYIGATISFKSRFSQHKTKFGKRNAKMAEYVATHGLDNLSMELIEECHKSKRFERESHYIETMKPSLNGIGGRPLKYGMKMKVVTFRVIKCKKFIRELRDDIKRMREEFVKNNPELVTPRKN